MTSPNAPTREIGYAQTPIMSTSGATTGQWWMFEDETTPELRWPQSSFVYDQMRRQDAQVVSVLRAVSLPIRRTPWRIDAAGARDEVVQLVAEDLGLPIVGQDPKPLPRTKDRFSWPDHLREALLMLPFGHMFFEQVYRIVNEQARLRKLGARMPKTIEQIDVARDGGLIAIRQYSTGGGYQQLPIPVTRLVAYVHEKEAGNWLGFSLLRPAYKNWLLKDRLLRVQAQTIERNGMGIPVYTAAPTEPSVAAGLSMATSLRSGETAGAAIPHEAQLKLMGVEGELPDAEPAIRYHDEQIGRAVLAHFLNLGTQTGSWALGSTFADFFTLSLQTLAMQIADVATQHIVEDLVDLNFGEGEPAPKIVFDEIGSRQAATAEAIRSLVDAGVITPDEVLERAVRQQFGLPTKDPDADPVAPQEPEDTELYASAGPVEEVDDDPIGELDDDTLILLQAMFEVEIERGLVQAAGFNPELHKRYPRGHPKAGKFRPMVDLLKMAIAKHDGEGHPFQNFKREQLRRAAKTRGITLRRNESQDSIAKKLFADLSGKTAKPQADKAAPAKKPARVQTWEELGSPQGPPPVGQVIGYEGGTYERLAGEPRRYRVVNSDGRDISDHLPTEAYRGGRGLAPVDQTADDARTALRVDAFHRERTTSDANSNWRRAMQAVPGTYRLDTKEIDGFDGATPAQRDAIQSALQSWKEDLFDTSRGVEPNVNAALRGRMVSTPKTEADTVALDTAFDLSRTSRQITVHRGVIDGQHILPDDWQDRDLTGLEWTDEAYTATSADEEAALAYAGPAETRGFAVRIKLPRGSSAIALPDEVGGLDAEAEVILPRGMTFRITRDHGPQGPHGVRTFDVKIVRRRTPAGSRRSRAADVPGTAGPAPDPAKKAVKKAAKKAAPAPTAAPSSRPGTRTVLGTDFSPAMQQALADIEDSGGLQKQRADYQLESGLSDDEMDRLVDDGFVEVDDSAGGGGYIAATPRGVRALAEFTATRPAAERTPVKKAAKKAAPAKRAARKAAQPAANPAMPGVTVQRVPTVFSVAPDAYEVNVNGTVVGHIHGNEADPDYGWVPFVPANSPWNMNEPGSKPSKEAAIQELVDSYNARPGAPTPARSAPPAATPSAAPANAPTSVPTEDEIDALPYRDYRDLAVEYGINLIGSRRDIIRQIREAMLADRGGAPRTPASSVTPAPNLPPPLPADPQSKLIGSLIPASYRDSVDRESEIRRTVEERLNGEYAGLTVRVVGVDATMDETDVSARIVDANGNDVGSTQRIFRRSRDGTLWVYHAYLSLNRDVQGQGFAEAWNSHLMNWYSESGLDRVEVTANIDVGGYTWARQGFDWKDKSAADGIAGRLRRHISDYADRYDASQINAAQDVIDRISSLRFGDPNFPTAYEVSQVGRKPGQGRVDSWPGKNAMLGSYWSGVKPVPAAGTRRVS